MNAARDALRRSRTRPRAGEVRIFVKCGQCGESTLADLIGNEETGIRRIIASEVSWDGKETVRSGPRKRKKFSSQAAPFAPTGASLTDHIEAASNAQKRVRFHCDHGRPPCGADIPVRRAKLDKAFRSAVRERRRRIYVPQDIRD
jgi:hypothetical protein